MYSTSDLHNSWHTKRVPVVGTDVVETLSKEVAVAVDTGQDRSSTSCHTPLVTRLDNKSLAFMCKEQVSDQMSMATQLDIDKHKDMHWPTDSNGVNTPFVADTLSARFHLSHSETHELLYIVLDM